MEQMVNLLGQTLLNIVGALAFGIGLLVAFCAVMNGSRGGVGR